MDSLTPQTRLLQVATIGPNTSGCSPVIYDFGIALGKALGKLDVHIVSGGMGGFMEAVFKGAWQIKQRQGRTIGILPEGIRTPANPYCDIVVPTGIGVARNQLVVNSGDIIVAVGGGAGTLSEIAFAWQLNKKVVCYAAVDGWSKRLAGLDLDGRRTGLLIKATSLDEIISHINAARKDFNVS